MIIGCWVNKMNYKNLLFKIDNICFTVLIIFALICTLKMAEFCLSGGTLNPDISLYSITALKYAGIDYYGIVNPEEIFYTPIISFLTSLLFRMGLVDKAAIIIVSAIFGFLGYIGLYFLLKTRFNSLLSLIGVVIFGSTSVVIFNLSKGMIDIPALSVSIWVLLFAIKSIDDNPKYFLITCPLFFIGFFVKYTMGFVLPVIFVYYLMNRNFIDVVDSIIYDKSLFKKKFMNYISSREFKYILVAIVIGFILAIIISKMLILDYGGSLTFFEQSVNSFNGNKDIIMSNIFNLDKSYYIDNFSDFLFEKQDFGLIFAYLLYVILALGFAVNLLNVIINSKFIESKRKSFKIKHFKKLLIVLLIISAFISFYGFKVLENNMVSNIAFICGVLFLYSLLNKFPCNEKKLSFNLLFLTFFMVNLIFFSLYPHKTFRYALPLLPSFVYAVVWALESIFDFLTNGFKNNETFISKISFDVKYSNLSKIIAIMLVLIFMLSTFSFILPMEFNRSNEIYQEVLYKGFSNDLDDACEYIINTDPDYHSKTFASFFHSSRIIRWNMNVNVTILDSEDSNLNSFDETDYIILYEDLEFDNYHKIKDCRDFHIYYHN